MQRIGLFSLSLTVKDLQKSKEFYEILGFEALGGDQSQGWLILSNGDTKLGLFQGMFDKNMLTFNPGWDDGAGKLEKFDDVRELQKRFRKAGIQFTSEADETTNGPASITFLDPDGNPILLDQHV